ncbi:spore germination protein [Clostridium sediminicola]|uniref:spore germination protein n=1 Tax=Clostridium sediminicola TaxID=3114879 RepID=UPI0031F1FBE9
MKKKNIFEDKIIEFRQENLGISIRELSVNSVEIYVLYIQQLTDKESLSTNVIKPILQNGKEDMLTIDKIVNSVIYVDDITIDQDENMIIDYVIKGKSIIILSNDDKYIVANTLKIEKRGIQQPELDTTLRGPKDSFTENFNDNISLVRYRIKDPALRIENYSIGRRTKTNVAVIYIENIANGKYVDEIKKRLLEIDVDGVFESGYIQKFISNSTFDLFPQTGIVERSDTACENIIEGKVCVIVEGSNLAIISPKTFIEFLDTGDDHFENIYLGFFSKVLRIISLLISLTLSSLYVAAVSFHSDILPSKYLLAIATSRVTVPFNALLEAILMEFTAEILREGSIRLPKQIGPTIGIVGTIVIGQAAVTAGLVSPLMVIIVALSIMGSFVSGDYTIMNTIRILKFVLIFMTGIFGLFGFVMGITIIAINLCSQTSFGIPYVAPMSPLNLKDMKNFIFSDVTLAKERPNFLKTKDKKRQ